MKHFPLTALAFMPVLALVLTACRSSGDAPEAHFPPEGVDHLAMTVRVEVEIFAIGKDTVDLKGTVAIHRSGPTGPEGSLMIGELIGASLRGKSKVFGEMIAVQSPLQRSPCRYTYEGPGQYAHQF